MIPHGVEVFIGLEPIGLRWGFDRLAGIVADRLTRERRAAARCSFSSASVASVQREKFIAKFGREPGPDDPIFFDMDEDTIREGTANAIRESGISSAHIYAYEETGLIVTQENRQLIPDVELREFDAKVREYYDLNPQEDPKVS